MYDIFEQLLQKHGVTPYRVSKETGIAQSVLSAWKNGVSTPKQDKMQKIADYFGVSIDYLMTGEDKKYYADEETAEMANKILAEDKILFDVYNSSKKEQLMDYARKLAELERMENELE